MALLKYSNTCLFRRLIHTPYALLQWLMMIKSQFATQSDENYCRKHLYNYGHFHGMNIMKISGNMHLQRRSFETETSNLPEFEFKRAFRMK